MIMGSSVITTALARWIYFSSFLMWSTKVNVEEVTPGKQKSLTIVLSMDQRHLKEAWISRGLRKPPLCFRFHYRLSSPVMRTYIAYQGVLLRSWPVKWKKRRLDRRRNYTMTVLTEALVHPGRNSDDRMVLDNIICWGWEVCTPVLISHWMWVPWKKVWSWLEAGSCIWGSSLRGLTPDGRLLAALHIAGEITLSVLKEDQSNAHFAHLRCAASDHMHSVALLPKTPRVGHHKMPRNAPAWWGLTLPVNFIGHQVASLYLRDIH